MAAKTAPTLAPWVLTKVDRCLPPSLTVVLAVLQISGVARALVVPSNKDHDVARGGSSV